MRWFYFLLTIILVSPLPSISQAAHPTCTMEDSDSDGDGFGWENNATCIVSPTTPTQTTYCSNASSDADGDGWGWENNESCKIQKEGSRPTDGTTPTCVYDWSDPDGDGFGWENSASCRVAKKHTPSLPDCSLSNSDPDGDGFGYENGTSCRVVQTESQINPYNFDDSVTWTDLRKITDVVVTAGQSNATGNKSTFDPSHPKDGLSHKIFVWTTKGWKKANPTNQLWSHTFYNPALDDEEGGKLPKRPGQSKSDNHPAFQIARALVEKDPSRVIAIIPTAMSGAGIDFWVGEGTSSYAYRLMHDTVNDALRNLPDTGQPRAANLFWWMQGESDHAPWDPFSHRYAAKFDRFFNQLHSAETWWFKPNTVFLANLTSWSSVNSFFRNIRQTYGVTTNYVDNASYFQKLFPNDDVHYNTEALRTIGDQVADLYAWMK